MAAIQVEVRDGNGELFFSEALEAAEWIEQRRLSGGVVWLARSQNDSGVVLVRRSADAPSNPGRWSYFSGAADVSDDVLLPMRLAREGSEELALLHADGSLVIPVLASALDARAEILAHVAQRFPNQTATLDVRPTLDSLHPHRVSVESDRWNIEGRAFASVWPKDGKRKLELAWFGALGVMDGVELVDGELAGGRPLQRHLRFVSSAELRDLVGGEPVTLHARAALEHLVART